MADAVYDAVVVGGGNKGLVTAMYLQKYGKMEVAIFERRHEIGGCWASEESPAPGFIADTHATAHGDWGFSILERDFPFRERGFEWIPFYVGAGGVFLEDQDQYLIYSPHTDESQERTAKSFAKFSKRDAETWLKLWDLWINFIRPAFLKNIHNPPPASLDEPDEMEKLLLHPEMKKFGINLSYALKSPIEVIRELFESDGLVAGLLRIVHSWLAVPCDLNGLGLFILPAIFLLCDMGGIKGGTHTAAHAGYKCFTEDGGKSFTDHEVDRILIENGKATGIRLTDGKEIKARKLVVTDLDPHTLCFRMIGREYLPWLILRKVENLSRWTSTSYSWYTWALHEAPHYKEAARINPDIDKVGWLVVGRRDPESLLITHAYRRLGQLNPKVEDIVVCNHPVMDKTRCPEGKWSILTEDYNLVEAHRFSDKEWRGVIKKHANQVLETIGKVAPNMTWDNVIGCSYETSFHSTSMPNLGPMACWSVIDHTPTQMGRYRPIPELARHKVPGIDGLYATGSAWPPGGGGFASQGYTCYKVIAEDFELERPWEKGIEPY